jgi:hypothetical protein
MKKGNMYQSKYFTKVIEEFDSKLIYIAGAPEEDVLEIGDSNAKEYLRLLKELSQTIEVAFGKIVKTFKTDDNLEVYRSGKKLSDKELYLNQIDILKKNLERKNAGRKRSVEKKGIQVSDYDVIEKRKNGMIIKDISKETGLSIATINRIIRKNNKK